MIGGEVDDDKKAFTCVMNDIFKSKPNDIFKIGNLFESCVVEIEGQFLDDMAKFSVIHRQPLGGGRVEF